MKANKLGFFQGDVVGQYILDLPKDVKPTKERIVARGETTGHHHIVEGVQTAYENKTGFYFVVVPEEKALLTHVGNDHETIELIAGIVFIPRESQVEYDGEDERRVLD